MPKTIQESWDRILFWLTGSNVNLGSICSPKPESELKKTEDVLGMRLPEDLESFYRITNGVKPGVNGVVAIFPPVHRYGGAMFPLTLSAIRHSWSMLKGLLEGGDFEGCDHDPTPSEIRNDFWRIGWIPFAGNEGGDFYCIDLEPTDSGTVGQVISHCHEGGKRHLIAESFGHYLAEIASGIEEDKFVYDQMAGLIPSKR